MRRGGDGRPARGCAVSAPRNGAEVLPESTRRDLAALIERKGGLLHAAVACDVAIRTLMAARDGKPIMRRSREAIVRALVLEGGR